MVENKPIEKNISPEKQVSPEIQEQFDIFVANGFNIIHDEEVSNDILNRILKSGEPIDAIAEATVDVVSRLSDSALESGIKLANETLVHGANILMGEIMNMAESAGMQKLSEEQRTQSYQLATSMYLDSAVKSGKMSQEELVALGKEVPQTNETGMETGQEQNGQGILNRGGV